MPKRVPPCAAKKWEEDEASEYAQALNDAESAEAEVVTEDGEEPVEESSRPADFGEDENNGLEDDEQTVEHRPESTSGLVGDRAASVNERH